MPRTHRLREAIVHKVLSGGFYLARGKIPSVTRVPIVQQLTREGNILRRSRNADPMGDMQITR